MITKTPMRAFLTHGACTAMFRWSNRTERASEWGASVACCGRQAAFPFSFRYVVVVDRSQELRRTSVPFAGFSPSIVSSNTELDRLGLRAGPSSSRSSGVRWRCIVGVSRLPPCCWKPHALNSFEKGLLGAGRGAVLLLLAVG